MTNERLSAVDAAWLRMDTPTNRMMITGIFIFDERLELGALEQLLEERLLSHERFRQRIVDGPRGPAWQLDPEFDLRSHLHHVALPAPGDRAALAELVSDLASSPLDRARPLWQAHLVDGLAGGGSALVTRLHHCIADGIALVRVLLSLTDDARGAAPRHVGRELPHVEGLVHRARLAANEARAAVRLVTLPPDPPTVLSERTGVRKRVAWSAPLPLAPLDARARAAGATINDVLLAAVAGALRDQLDARHAWRDGLEVRAMIPVNLRGGNGNGNGNGRTASAIASASSTCRCRSASATRTRASPSSSDAWTRSRRRPTRSSPSASSAFWGWRRSPSSASASSCSRARRRCSPPTCRGRRRRCASPGGACAR